MEVRILSTILVVPRFSESGSFLSVKVVFITDITLQKVSIVDLYIMSVNINISSILKELIRMFYAPLFENDVPVALSRS